MSCIKRALVCETKSLTQIEDGTHIRSARRYWVSFNFHRRMMLKRVADEGQGPDQAQGNPAP